MTTLPTWAAIAVAIGSPLAAFLAVFLTRKSATELEARARREENGRTLRWAAELAVSDDVRTARLGVAALEALSASASLQEEEQALIDAVTDAVLEDATEAYDALGGTPEVYELRPSPPPAEGQDSEDQP